MKGEWQTPSLLRPGRSKRSVERRGRSRVLLRTASGGTRESGLPRSALRAAVSALAPWTGSHWASWSAVRPAVQRSQQPLVPGTQPAFHSRVAAPTLRFGAACLLRDHRETPQSCAYVSQCPKFPEVNQPGSFPSCSLGPGNYKSGKDSLPLILVSSLSR